MRQITYILLFIFLNTALLGAEPETQFSSGLQAYEAGKYQEAIDSWTAIEKDNFQSFELFYNLGNAYFKLEKFPHAVLYFEKALQQKPFSSEARQNLILANENIIKQIKPLPEFFLKKWWGTLAGIFKSNTWSWLSLLLFWGGVTLILARLLKWQWVKIKKPYPLAAGLIIFSFLFLLLGVSKGNMEQNSEMAIVLKGQIELRSAPESTIDIIELPAGTKLIIIDHIGEWEKVKAPNGELGWIHKNDAEKI